MTNTSLYQVQPVTTSSSNRKLYQMKHNQETEVHTRNISLAWFNNKRPILTTHLDLTYGYSRRGNITPMCHFIIDTYILHSTLQPQSATPRNDISCSPIVCELMAASPVQSFPLNPRPRDTICPAKSIVTGCKQRKAQPTNANNSAQLLRSIDCTLDYLDGQKPWLNLNTSYILHVHICIHTYTYYIKYTYTHTYMFLLHI